MSINAQIALLALVLLTILVLVYWLFRIKKTDDYIRIYLKLRSQHPNVSAFCLGYDSKRARYHNVTVVDAQKFEFKDQYDAFPIDLDARLTIQKNHGIISDQKNGFTISEVGLSSSGTSGAGGSLIDCPPGFVGPTCQLAPICVAGADDDKYFPLTTAQFNNLGQFDMRSFTPITRTTRQNDTAKPIRSAPYHPRIRVHCMPKASNNNEYELQVCPENKLLNFETLKCQSYDVCSDMIDGSKHHYGIDDTGESANALKDPKAYYLCNKRKSILQKCDENTHFSVSQMSCISKSQCFGKPNGLTFPRDEKSFIRCENDLETIVDCSKNGVDPNSPENGLKCRVNLCTTGYESINDGVLEYYWRERLCKDDNPYYNVCTTDKSGVYLLQLLGNSTYTKYQWSQEFNIPIEHYPNKILLPSFETRLCTENFDFKDVLTSKTDDPTVPVSWGKAWKTAHDFSIKRRRFNCCDAGQYNYGWDVMRQGNFKTMAESARLVKCSDFDTVVDRSIDFYDTSRPCVNEPIKFAKDQFYYRFDLQTSQAIYFPYKNFPLLIGIKHTYPKSLLGKDTFWPCINKKTKIISFYLLTRKTDDSYTLLRVQGTTLPDGFSLTTKGLTQIRGDEIPLSLAGLSGGYPSAEQREKYFWLTIYSGTTNTPQIPEGSTTTPIIEIVDNEQQQYTPNELYRRVDEEKLAEHDTIVCEDPLVERKGMKLTNTTNGETADIVHYNLVFFKKIAEPEVVEKNWLVYYSGLEFHVTEDTMITF